MRIDCEQCGAAYSIDDALITDRGVRAQCPKCGHQKVVKKAAAAAPSPFGGPPAGNPFAPPAGANPFAPPSSANADATAVAAPNPFAPPSGAGNPFAAPGFGPPPSGNNTVPNAPNPFAPPTQPMGNPFGAGSGTQAGGNPFAPAGNTTSNSAIGGAPITAPNPFNAPVSSPPAPAPSPFGAPPSSSPFGGGAAPSPFGTNNGFLGAPTPPPVQPANYPPPTPGAGANAFAPPVADPFAAVAPSPSPMADPFGAQASPPTDPFAKLAQAPVRGAMGTADGGPPPGAIAPVAAPRPVTDPFAALGAQPAPLPAPAPRPSPQTQPPKPVEDPFAKLDIGGPSTSSPPSQAPSWRVKTKAGMDAEMDLSQLRDLVKGGQVGVNDEAAPVGEPLKPIHAQPALATAATPKPTGKKPAGARARVPPSFGRILAALIGIGAVVVVGGVLTLKPELFESTTDAGVNPLRRAKPSWEKQFPEVTGTAAEHLDAGKAQMKLDTAAGYRKADEELRQALLLDVGNIGALAAWVENFTNLPAIHTDPEAANLAAEAVAYAQKRDPKNTAVLRALGALKLAQGEVDQAQKALLEAQQLNGAELDTVLVLAKSHLDRNPEEALRLVQTVRVKDPSLKAAYVVEGAAQRRLGALKEARDALQSRLMDDPTNTGALKELARLELDIGTPEPAIAALTKLVEATERDVEAHLLRAKIAYQILETPDALTRADGYLDNVLKNYESSAGDLLLPLLSHAAFVKAELGKLDDAQKLAERAKASAIDGGYAPALFVLGRVYALKGNLNEAKAALEQAVRVAEAKDQFYWPVVRAELARVQALAGDEASAVRNYTQVIDYDPRYTRAHFGLAATFMATDRAPQAMTYMRKALENDPHFDADHPLLTDYPVARRDLVAFADAFKNMKAPPDDESLAAQKLATEAMIRYYAHQTAEAEALCKRALAEDRVNLFALLYLGVIELDTGRDADARKHLRLAVDTTGAANAMARLYLARAEIKTGEKEVAKKRLQDLIDQDASLSQALFTKSMIARDEKLEGQAQDELRKIVKNDQDFMPAKRALAESP
jgi:predicted Zn finger-like uncharacterized protein